MNRDQVTRRDFPSASEGYDRLSVDAHLEAVAATIVALEAQVKAVEVERDALRRSIAADAEPPPRIPTRITAVPEPEPVEGAGPIAGTEPVDEAEPLAGTEPEPAVPANDGGPEAVSTAGDQSGARLVAMKMALDGSDREVVRERLEADYDLSDIEALLDDVFKRVG